MKKRLFLLFILVLSAWLAAAIIFIQSPRFATIFKKVAARYIPGDLGVDGDFSEFAIQLFPPGISLKNPKITLRERNVLKMPAGTTVQAQRINLNFELFQTLSGEIRIHEAEIVDGEATLVLDSVPSETVGKAEKKRLNLNFHWDELLQVRAESIALKNTRMHLIWKHASDSETIDFLAQLVRLSQWSGKGGLGYEASIHLTEMTSKLAHDVIEGVHLPTAIDELHTVARVNGAGATLEEFLLNLQGVSVRSTGKIQGDILNAKGEKKFELDLTTDGELQNVHKLVRDATGSDIGDIQGRGVFKGKLQGSVDSKIHLLKAEGRLELEKLEFQKWKADHFSIEGGWTSSDRGGEIAITRGFVSSEETERQNKPASGGEIEIGAFKLSLGEITSPSNPVLIPLNLKRAHLHWLLGPVAHSVYSLLFRATGPVQLTWTSGGRKDFGQIQAQTSLMLSDFQLDNQVPGVSRPFHRILKIPQMSIRGTTVIDSEGVKPKSLNLAINHTKMKIDGAVNFKSGFNFYGSGYANLSEVGEIAESPIRGEGPLSVHVHGPASDVILDFDADLQKASYLNMDYGNLKGRITWNNHLHRLLLTGIRANQGETFYLGQGRIDLGNRQNIDIRVKVPNGNVRDLSKIFAKMTEDLSWYPQSSKKNDLNGTLDGEVVISGGVKASELQVTALLNGKNWDYRGERFDRVSFVGGLDQGLYYIRDLNAKKYGGRITGRISYLQSQKKLDWELESQQLRLSDLDHLAQFDVPIRGKLLVKSSGKGTQGSIQSHSEVLVSDLSIRGSPLPSSEFILTSENRKLELKSRAFEGQGVLDLNYPFTEGRDGALRFELSRFDFSRLLLLLNPEVSSDSTLVGQCSGVVNLFFRTGSIDRSNGNFELKECLIAKSGTSFRLVRPVSFKIVDGSFDLKDLSLAGNRGVMTLRLQGNKGDLDGKIAGPLDISIAEFLTSSISQANGVASLDFAIGGTLKNPSFNGKGSLEGVSFRGSFAESPFENLVGNFQLRQNHLLLKDFQADLAGGVVRAGGEITIFADRYPYLDLTGSLTGSKIKVPPFQFAKVAGNLKVYGTNLPYAIDGSLVVDSALLKENMLKTKTSSALKVVRYTPPPSLNRMADYPHFKLNIDVKSNGGILIQNDLFDAELKAQIKVVNTLEVPRILGAVDVLHGKMLFKDRFFQIQSASAVFDNPTLFNPRFNLSATTDMSWVKVQLYASGRVGGVGRDSNQEQWKVELSSNPSMPESEIISLLALGMTVNETKKLNSTDRSVLEQGEAASLLLHSLDFNREVENKTGFQIRLDESVDSQEGTSFSRPQSSTNESGVAPKIVIKKQLTKNLDVSYGSTVGVGTSTRRQVNAEIKVTPGLSVLGVWDTYQGSETKDRRTSYGMDLKLQKRFK